ncbi:helicase associated domain-containing protein [Streptomyces sp. NPDC127038]|uniref:helicase associated domain-containing protein n=1 Tax=Streptomyces sp. NPDC127038 TaxID=3347114 RepID=UPI00364A4E77
MKTASGVIDPESTYWRRGVEAATRWLRETGTTELRVPCTCVVPVGGPGVGGYPLGVWVAARRRACADGPPAAERVRELDAPDMVRSAHDTGFATGFWATGARSAGGRPERSGRYGLAAPTAGGGRSRLSCRCPVRAGLLMTLLWQAALPARSSRRRFREMREPGRRRSRTNRPRSHTPSACQLSCDHSVIRRPITGRWAHRASSTGATATNRQARHAR